MTIPPNVRFTVWVPGRPTPQGSMQAMVLHPKAGPARAAVKYAPQVIQWRHKVTNAVNEAVRVKGYDKPLFAKGVPIGITLSFFLTRPLSHYGTGRNANRVADRAPLHPSTAPDLDKLVRAIFDGITDSGAWADDSQVVWLQATKRWADPDQPEGVEIMMGVLKT